MKKKTLLFLFGLQAITLFAQIDHEKMHQAYLKGELTYWGETLKKHQNKKLTKDELPLISNYEYGYIPWCIERKKDEEARLFIASFTNHIKELELLKYNHSTICVYKSAICAYKITYNKWKFASLASESIDFANKAVDIDPTNPLSLSLKGNVDFYKPAMFGGSKKNAIDYYEKAILQFEKKGYTHNNWNYLATMLCCAQALEKTGKKDDAISYCRKILESSPNFAYVRDIYYPSLLKK